MMTKFEVIGRIGSIKTYTSDNGVNYYNISVATDYQGETTWINFWYNGKVTPGLIKGSTIYAEGYITKDRKGNLALRALKILVLKGKKNGYTNTNEPEDEPDVPF